MIQLLRFTSSIERMLGGPRANKTDAGNGSDGICRVIDAFPLAVA